MMFGYVIAALWVVAWGGVNVWIFIEVLKLRRREGRKMAILRSIVSFWRGLKEGLAIAFAKCPECKKLGHKCDDCEYYWLDSPAP